jgi:1-acyl-sn-glycerol-3-phosphate acyltransferase
MLPPSPVRRLVLVPLVVAIAAALAVLAPALALLTAAFSLVRRRLRKEDGVAAGRRHRMRALRVVCFALVWALGETAALTVMLCLWIVSGFGGRLDTEPYQSRHYGVMRWFLALIYRTAERVCGLRVTVTGPMTTDEGRPLIVLSRHAGPGDSLLLVHHLLSACDRRPRVVMKETLQLDPSVDVLANRLPNAFIRRQRGIATPHTELIKRLAASLDPRGALLIFPEGGNWTPQRWRRAIARLRRRHRDDLAERAAAMPNVLPPRHGGAFAAIAACPAADVIFVAHTGLDRLVSVRDVWQSLSGDILVRAHWWRVPAAGVPRDADYEAQLRWLYDWWQRVDAWITAQNPSQQALSRSDPEILYPERKPLTPDASPLFRQVADGLDVVPVRVANEGGVVVLVVLRPYPRLVQDRDAEGAGRFAKCPDRLPVRRGEGDVRLAEAVPCRLRPDPEVRPVRRPVTDRDTEVHDSLSAKRREDRVIERSAGRHVGALDTQVVEHGDHCRSPVPIRHLRHRRQLIIEFSQCGVPGLTASLEPRTTHGR